MIHVLFPCEKVKVTMVIQNFFMFPNGFMPICWGVPQLLDPYIYLLIVLFH